MEFHKRRALVIVSVCGALFLAFDSGRSSGLARATPRAIIAPRVQSFPHSDPFPVRLSSAATPDYASYIDDASVTYGVSRDLIHAIVQTESEFDPLAVSPRGACGLMQLMPRTARSFGAIDCFDARQNIRAGTRYLKLLMTRYDGSLAMSIAAYHAGESAVARHRGVPPYRDTRAYVRRVTSLLLAGPDGAGSRAVSRNRQG